ncbi:ABC transporter periplasmic substrate-binding protein, partial [Pseudomonas savastanoi pv. glycinea str. race 4]
MEGNVLNINGIPNQANTLQQTALIPGTKNGNPTGMQGFVFNLRKPVFQDVRVREALTLLLDFEWTNKQLFNGS